MCTVCDSCKKISKSNLWSTWCWDLRLDKLSKFSIKTMIAMEDVKSKHSTKLKHQE